MPSQDPTPPDKAMSLQEIYDALEEIHNILGEGCSRLGSITSVIILGVNVDSRVAVGSSHDAKQIIESVVSPLIDMFAGVNGVMKTVRYMQDSKSGSSQLKQSNHMTLRPVQHSKDLSLRQIHTALIETQGTLDTAINILANLLNLLLEPPHIALLNRVIDSGVLTFPKVKTAFEMVTENVNPANIALKELVTLVEALMDAESKRRWHN